MGNNVSGVSHIAGALDSYVSELGADVVYEKRYRHEQTPSVMLECKSEQLILPPFCCYCGTENVVDELTR